MSRETERGLVRVAIITGGPGPEHDASIESALGVLEHREALRAEFRFTVCVITKGETWLDVSASNQYLQMYSSEGAAKLQELEELDKTGLHTRTPWEVVADADIVFPIIHGVFGEDGVVLGLCRALKRPFVGCGTLSSTICLDKAICNALLVQAGIPKTPHEVVLPDENEDDIIKRLKMSGLMKPPWIVKPTDGGCSLGVSMVQDVQELPAALAKSRQTYPSSAIVLENAVEDMIEVDVTVLERLPYGSGLIATICGHHLSSITSSLMPPAGALGVNSQPKERDQNGRLPEWAVSTSDISKIAQIQMQNLAMRIFRIVRASTFLRVDFFFVPTTGQIFVNEINTMPSLASEAIIYKLWAAAGIPAASLIQHIITHSLQKCQ